MTRALVVKDFMTPMPRTVGHDQSLATAHRIMGEHQIRHLPVLESGKVVGIVSMGDLHFIETLKGVDPEEVRVAEAMTPDPFTVAPDAPLGQVARRLAEHKYGAALVIDRGHVVGMFTTVDALRALASVLETRANHKATHP